MRGRRGFTLVELLVVTVLGALVVMASLQVLITNQRTFTAQNAEIQGQQALRAAMDVLTAELREVSASGGDILAMAEDSVKVRLMRKLAIACQVDTTNSGNPYVRAMKIGDDWFAQQDSAYVFADNDEDDEDDDVWIRARVTQVDTTSSCSGLSLSLGLGGGVSLLDSTSTQILTFAGQKARFTADSVRVGAPVRSFVTYTYGLYTYNGEPYLGRTTPGGAVVPLVGPLREDDGVSFDYRDAEGDSTTVATDVRQVVVTLRWGSGILNSLGESVSDSLSSWIYTRN